MSAVNVMITMSFHTSKPDFSTGAADDRDSPTNFNRDHVLAWTRAGAFSRELQALAHYPPKH